MSIAALQPLRPIKLWSPIGLEESQQSLIEVNFESGGNRRDVTANQVVLSLDPLQIAVGDASSGLDSTLRFRDRARGMELGKLCLQSAGNISVRDTTLSCFSISSSRHACLPPVLGAWQRWLQARRHRADNGSFSMSAAAVQHLLVFYICPRPVMLVSVSDGQHENLFPMDLVGTVGGLFTLALRNSSPSVATMSNAKRAVLADVRLTDQPLAYALGAHHRQKQIDWSMLSCEMVRSAHFGFRVPAGSPRVRELEILDAHVRGSHTIFMCRVVSEELRGRGPQLFHTSGIHHAWRRRRGQAPWREPGAP